MNGYRKAIQLGLTGTDAAIVANLKTLTLRDIDASEAADWLREGGYWQEGPSGMTGTLVAPYTASTGNNRKRFDDCWGYLYSTSANRLITTNIIQSVRVNFLITQIPGLNGTIRDSFYSLGGGRPYATITEQEFADQRTAALAEDALAATKQTLEDAAVDRLQAFREALSSWNGSREAPVL